MTRFTFPLCSHLPHATSPTPISSTTSIIDLGDASLSSLWQLRNHLQEASTLSTANYPETLHNVAIVNSPSFFPVVWRWIKVGNGIFLFPQKHNFMFSRAGLTRALVVKYMFWEEIQDPLYWNSLMLIIFLLLMEESLNGSTGMNPILTTKLKNCLVNYPKVLLFLLMEPSWQSHLRKHQHCFIMYNTYTTMYQAKNAKNISNSCKIELEQHRNSNNS